MFENLLNQNGLSFERLRNFCAIAEAGGIVRAVGSDPVRQSLLSRQVRELEEFFHVELVRRKGKGIELTEAGNELARLARLHLQGLEDFKQTRAGKPLTCRIASGNSVLEWWLMPRLRLLEPKVGYLHWHIFDLRSGDVIRGLLDHTLDFGIVRKSAVVAPLVSKPLLEIGYALFYPSVWGNRPASSLLKDSPLAISMGGEFLEQLQRQAIRHKIGLQPTHQCTSFTQASQLVRAGAAAAILPDLATEPLGTAATRVPLPWLNDIRRYFHLAWHQRLMDTRPQSESVREALLGLK